jgi:hypothetical protein
MSAGLRLFSDPDDHNDSAQKELEKQSDADSPDLLESGAGVSSWPWEESLPTDNAESASDDPLSLLLFQPRNKNRRTPGEDAFVVNEVTNAALPEQKMASQLASEPCTTDESGNGNFPVLRFFGHRRRGGSISEAAELKSRSLRKRYRRKFDACCAVTLSRVEVNSPSARVCPPRPQRD